MPALAAATAIDEFEVELLDGTALRSDDLGGKVVLLDFWTTWCVPCITKMPEMAALSAQYGGRDDSVFVSVNRGERVKTIRSFMDRHPYTFPVGIDTARHLRELFQASPLPYTVLLDKQGRLRLRHFGYDGAEEFAADLGSHIDELLAEPDDHQRRSGEQ